MSEFLNNLDRLHTTPAGAERIKRNLGLETDDVAAFCRDFVRTADVVIGLGKNFYVYRDGLCVTVNAHSLTVITAHRIRGKIRPMEASDYPCLNELLYQAIFIPSGVEQPAREIIFDPAIFIYIEDFGKRADDVGVVAEVNGQVVGAAWTRMIPAFGYVDDQTPELAIALLPEFRGCGIGTKLMKKLFGLLKARGYAQTSLSVQKDNPAVRFYARLGYRIIEEKPDNAGHNDYIMIKDLERVDTKQNRQA